MQKNNGWTPERRKRQSEAIKRWKPWNKSTGPKSSEGKAVVSGNAWAGGHWAQLRELTKQVNAEVRAARELVNSADKEDGGLAFEGRGPGIFHSTLTESF